MLHIATLPQHGMDHTAQVEPRFPLHTDPQVNKGFQVCWTGRARQLLFPEEMKQYGKTAKSATKSKHQT